MMPSLRWCLLAAIACAMLTGCGEDEVPDYGEAIACGVDTATVADVLGTRAFFVENNQDTFPIETGHLGATVDTWDEAAAQKLTAELAEAAGCFS